MATVEITGWRVGMRKVSHTQALQSFAGLNLVEAKAATDAVLAGKVVLLSVVDKDSANVLVEKLGEFGAIARVLE